jgi:PAS domain S-box-containing protein
MEREVLLALFNNATLLLALSVIYEVAYLLPFKNRNIQLVFTGILIALTCGAVMGMPFTLQSGIIFDTRSILISVTALVFGLVPTGITVLVAIFLRLSIGGIGALPGIAVIVTSAMIGLVWRRWVFPRSTKLRWLNIFAMSLCVHVVMLACMLILPYPNNINVISALALPVMLIYPVATVLLSLLLIRQQMLKQTQEQLKQSEERFKLLFDKAPLGYQSLDEEGYFIEVNQQWCDLLGYTREEVIGKWFGDFLSPENREAFQKRFPVFKAQGFIHSEFEVQHKSGKPLYIAFEGRIGYGVQGEFKQTHCILQDITSQKAAERALLESEKKYRNIAENVSDVVWQTDLELNTIYISPSIEKLVGDPPTSYCQRSPEERFPQQSLTKIRAMILEELENEKYSRFDKNRSKTIEIQHYRSDGSVIWIEMNASIMRDSQDKAIGFLGVSRDITSRKHTEMALKESERSKSVLLSNLPGMAYRCRFDRDWTMLFVSAGSTELTGYSPESLIHNRDLSFNDLINPKYRESLWKEWEHITSHQLPFQFEYEITTKSGEHKWVLEMGEGVYKDDGSVDALEGIIIDISDRKALESKLKYMNEHDSLTGLNNLRYLTDILKKDQRKALSGKRALVSVNLSTINQLSMKYGFIYSQEIITKAASMLKSVCNDACRLFHTYENRFAFYFLSYRDFNDLTAKCESIADALRPLLLAERIGGGIGVVEIDNENTVDVDRILGNLMLASESALMNTSADVGFCFYDSAMEAERIREQEIECEISDFTASGSSSGLFMQFQPILDLRTNKICGFEALARMRSNSFGVVSPVEFIPIAEKTKLIVPLGNQIIYQALDFLNEILSRGYNSISVAINISIIQLIRDDFIPNLLAILKEKQIKPDSIEVEVTESVFASNYQEINRLLGILRDNGIKIAIDDFGTEYSSLSRERDLNIDSLKIDRSFMKGLLELDDHEAITGDIISMAHKLGHTVIAEGVEHELQLQYLRENNCDRVQGYLISKPLDAQDALLLLENYTLNGNSN